MNKKQLLDELKLEGFSRKILDAFSKVKREDFVPSHLKKYAYNNEPLPIGDGATISQPYTIAFMLDLLELDKLNNETSIANKTKRQESSRELSENKPKILEIGSGCGYVLALINEINKNSEIYGIERIKDLVEKSRKLIPKKIRVIHGDGSNGLQKETPFNRILVSAAFPVIPENLFEQLKERGILLSPIKNSIFQFKKINGKIKSKEFYGFVFVPIIKNDLNTENY